MITTLKKFKKAFKGNFKPFLLVNKRVLCYTKSVLLDIGRKAFENMFLHLGSNISIPLESVIGVFDLELTTVTGYARDLLKKAEVEKKVISISDDMPKSFVLAEILFPGEKEKTNYVYLTSISASTLRKRVMMF